MLFKQSDQSFSTSNKYFCLVRSVINVDKVGNLTRKAIVKKGGQ